MTKKDFDLIALHFHYLQGRLRGKLTTNELEDLIAEMGSRLERTNPRFDIMRFREACLKAV